MNHLTSDISKYGAKYLYKVVSLLCLHSVFVEVGWKKSVVLRTSGIFIAVGEGVRKKIKPRIAKP